MSRIHNFPFYVVAVVSLLLTISVPAHKKLPSLICKPEQRAFLEKEYDVGVKEIETRIAEEHELFMQKIVFVGAVLGSVFFSKVKLLPQKLTSTPTMTVCCWVAVAVAAIMDVRLMFNSIIIGERGRWIQVVENIFLTGENANSGWESFFHSDAALWQPPQSVFVFADRQLLTSVLFVLALFLSTYPTEEASAQKSMRLFKLAAACCLLLIALPGTYLSVSWLHIAFLAVGLAFTPFIRQRH